MCKRRARRLWKKAIIVYVLVLARILDIAKRLSCRVVHGVRIDSLCIYAACYCSDFVRLIVSNCHGTQACVHGGDICRRMHLHLQGQSKFNSEI